MTAALIGLDWGTTSLRAYLLAADGAILDRRASAQGIMAVAGGDFAGVLAATVGDWRQAHPGIPLLASGMIGSRQGWREAPYCPCPARLADVAAGGAEVRLDDGGSLRILPGLSFVDRDGVPEVMRGEEVQIFGAVGAATERCLVVLPGTHSKWAVVADGRIDAFSTYMTGETFAALRGHTILGRLMEGDGDDADAFAQGVDAARGMEAAGGLLRRLFSARTLPLFGRLPATGVASYLSGLLIGAEVAGALGWCAAAGVNARAAPIVLVGNDVLSRLYAAAMARFDMAATSAPADVAALGQWRVARAAGLVN